MKEVCKVDGFMSPEFMAAIKAGGKVEVNSESVVGWIAVSKRDLEFRNSVEYRVVPKKAA